MPSSKSYRALLRKSARATRLAARPITEVRLGAHVPSRELVDHPQHYGGDVPHEVIKCMEAWGLESDALLWNTVKYIARVGKKADRLTDLKKAAFYLDRRIRQLQRANAGEPQPAKDSREEP